MSTALSLLAAELLARISQTIGRRPIGSLKFSALHLSTFLAHRNVVPSPEGKVAQLIINFHPNTGIVVLMANRNDSGRMFTLCEHAPEGLLRAAAFTIHNVCVHIAPMSGKPELEESAIEKSELSIIAALDALPCTISSTSVKPCTPRLTNTYMTSLFSVSSGLVSIQGAARVDIDGLWCALQGPAPEIIEICGAQALSYAEVLRLGTKLMRKHNVAFPKVIKLLCEKGPKSPDFGRNGKAEVIVKPCGDDMVLVTYGERV